MTPGLSLMKHQKEDHEMARNYLALKRTDQPRQPEMNWDEYWLKENPPGIMSGRPILIR